MKYNIIYKRKNIEILEWITRDGYVSIEINQIEILFRLIIYTVLILILLIKLIEKN